MSSIFDGIKDAKGTDRLSPPTPGRYRFKVLRHVNGLTFEGKAPFFRAELGVVEATGEGASPAGSSVSFFAKRNVTYPHYFLAEVKAYVAALLDEPPHTIEPSVYEELCSEANPGAGSEIMCTVVPRPGKFFQDGSPVLDYRWQAAPAAATAEVVAQGAAKSKAGAVKAASK